MKAVEKSWQKEFPNLWFNWIGQIGITALLFVAYKKSEGELIQYIFIPLVAASFYLNLVSGMTGIFTLIENSNLIKDPVEFKAGKSKHWFARFFGVVLFIITFGVAFAIVTIILGLLKSA